MSRCSEAERQLAQSRDLEGGLGFGGDDEEGDGYEEGGAGGSSAGENHLICFSLMTASLKLFTFHSSLFIFVSLC